MIKSFDKQNLKQLRMDMESALLQVAQKHNIKIQVGSARFTESNTTFKVELSTKSTDGTVNTRSVQDFKDCCASYGLKPEHLGATFSYLGERFRLDGMAGSRSIKYVFLATKLRDGKQYRVPEAYVRELQSKDYKPLSALLGSADLTPAMIGGCSNQHKFSFAEGKEIGQCPNKATTRRKEGIGKRGEMKPYCEECARLIDECRAEMEAEARCS
jgi:hypothetical protein